ncbi:hypothetical protein RF11_03875 [Thelohanellus kitauei]|uniref:Reverse transcriptase/retrotransposon-derived protein RNase H-like domain-containing protein n=1 Tax=Thelohanellus kitauei TaxID=669202 RepID=A0A0C2J5L3_THEKT|nr:hypothetical protein RF11_03875 [Thelohanellus kitauei]
MNGNNAWVSTEQITHNLNTRKKSPQHPPILCFPNFSEFILDVDGRNNFLGAILSQKVEGTEIAVMHDDKTLTKPDINYEVDGNIIEYDLDVQYRKGTENINTDYLSRKSIKTRHISLSDVDDEYSAESPKMTIISHRQKKSLTG